MFLVALPQEYPPPPIPGRHDEDRLRGILRGRSWFRLRRGKGSQVECLCPATGDARWSALQGRRPKCMDDMSSGWSRWGNMCCSTLRGNCDIKMRER